jgi:hypothetical protein
MDRPRNREVLKGLWMVQVFRPTGGREGAATGWRHEGQVWRIDCGPTKKVHLLRGDPGLVVSLH